MPHSTATPRTLTSHAKNAWQTRHALQNTCLLPLTFKRQQPLAKQEVSLEIQCNRTSLQWHLYLRCTHCNSNAVASLCAAMHHLAKHWVQRCIILQSTECSDASSCNALSAAMQFENWDSSSCSALSAIAMQLCKMFHWLAKHLLAFNDVAAFLYTDTPTCHKALCTQLQ